MAEGYITSFFQLFEADKGPHQIDEIQVPLIQRDYAQGRSDANASMIRGSFLEALHEAVVGDQSISLDFVYGDVVEGRLEPLDGQQRLTTLFLLHWYIASRAGKLATDARWKQFRYATRPSAERFCALLGEHAYPGSDGLAQWLRNQSWYLHTWNYDPTVQSMLTMLDAIHCRFGSVDFELAWDRMTSSTKPAVSFNLLPLDASQGSALYIKMNSRGKPLTSFENFKAHMEQVVAALDDAPLLGGKMDTTWPDIFWPYRDSNTLVDDQMLRYLEFLFEVTFWRENEQAKENTFRQVQQLFNTTDPKAPERLAWLIAATDIWAEEPISNAYSISAYFGEYLESDASGTPGRLPIYRADLDLLEQCCKTYSRSGNPRKFGWPETLLLYAFIIHRMGKTTDFRRRLRILRNLIEASANELRLDLMPGLIRDVETLVSTADIRQALHLTTFNAAQRAHELKKVEVLENEPSITGAMWRLEDHHLLRGSLFAFNLDTDATTFNARAAMFNQCFDQRDLWPDLACGLLAIGNYSRLKGARFYFGSGQETSWREVFTGGDHHQAKETRRILALLLDKLAQSPADCKAELQSVTAGYLATPPGAGGYDWRLYMVRYPTMRDGRSGIYVSVDRQLGYCLCMLDRTQLNSYYRDAVISAIVMQAAVAPDRVEQMFFGGAHNARRMKLKRSGMTVECVPEGFKIIPPVDAAQLGDYLSIAANFGIVSDSLNIAKMPDGITDAVDRIDLGGKFLADLVTTGL
ncbi:DUF262 domain-containing protein [Devosia sp. 919]|uniref:DUF262 domain-containing protein n=1 Tax=Devosia sp. 919 TaxID=2726065 RepID=UPI001552CFD3|nr:DUF262 domain-containing protein [Devosia sp. 919]